MRPLYIFLKRQSQYKRESGTDASLSPYAHLPGQDCDVWLNRHYRRNADSPPTLEKDVGSRSPNMANTS